MILIFFAVVLLLIMGRLAISSGRPQERVISNADFLGRGVASQSSVRSKDKKLATALKGMVVSLREQLAVSVLLALSATCLVLALITDSIALALIGLVLSIGIVTQAVVNIDYRMLTSVTSHSSSFATILSSYATLPGRLTTTMLARLAVRVRELPTIRMGGAAYARSLAVLTVSTAMMVIGALITSTSSAFAGDAGLAASSSSSYGLFAVSGVVVLALAAVAKLGFARRS